MPVFAQLSALQKLTGLLYFPITPTFPHFGLLGFLGYLPAKFKIRFLEPIPTDQWGAGALQRPRPGPERRRRHPRPHPGRAVRHARQAQARCGSDEGPRHRRSSSFWGGKLAQALERDPEVEVIIGVSPDDPTLELERTEYVRVGTQHALLRRIVRAARDRHGGRLAADRRLRPPPARAHAHEANVIGTMNILAACCGPDSPVRKFVFKSTAHYYGCEQDDPAFFTERMQRPHPPRTALERDIVEAEKAVAPFAERNPDVTVTTLRFVNGLGPGPADRRTPRCSRCPWCRRSSASTRATSSSTRTTSSACSSTPCARTCPASTTPPATACSCSRRSRACSASRWRRSCRRGGRAWRCRALRLLGIDPPPEMAQPAALRPRRRQPQAQGRGSAAAPHYARDGAGVRRAPAGARLRQGRRRAPYRYEREVEEFLRYSPSVGVGERGASPH